MSFHILDRKRVGMGLAVAGALASSWAVGPAQAQNYPSKPIRLVVPFVPGGGSDATARVIAAGMSDRLGQQVIVENRGGANTIVGTEYVAGQRPDGYTLLVCTGSFVINPSLYRLKYDTLRDFTPVTQYLSGQLLLVVHPSIPARNTKELLALARSKPGELTFASYGAGSPAHLAGELLKNMTRIDMLHIPFKGSAPSISEVVAGRVSMTFGVVVPVMPHVKAGKLRAIGFATPERRPAFPDIPTIAETVPGFEAVGFNGICAHSGTPPDIVERLNAVIQDTLAQPEIRDRIVRSGADLVDKPKGPKEFGALVRAEIAKWRKVVDSAGIKLE